ncbi:MAG: hypothetical protein AAGA36_12335 [Pseudomonadota bacterium]
MKYHLSLFLACTALAACGGDPVADSNKALEDAKAEWEKAKSIMAPTKRVSEYEDILADLKAIPERYPETPIGQSLAAGGSVSGVSIDRYEAEKDRLAERAACYANPTEECLLPFTSPIFDRDGTDAVGTANGGRNIVCTDGFDAAIASLEGKRVNQRLYADELVQVGFAAAACDKPAAVEQAIAAYVQAEPFSMDRRATKIAQILSTPELKAGWGPAIDELETLLGVQAITAQTKASVGLSLTSAYAKLWDTGKAVEKYTYVTETLGFQVSDTLNTGGTLIAAGAVDEGVALAKKTSGLPKFEDQRAIAHIAWGVRLLSDELGLSKNGIVRIKNAAQIQSIEDYFATPDGKDLTAAKSAVSKIAATLDSFDSSTWRKAGSEQLDATSAYAYLGLIHRKLGDAAAAKASLSKAEDIATKLAAPSSSLNVQYGTFLFLIAMADGDLEAMRATALSSGGYGSQHIPAFIKAAVAEDKIELAINTMAEASPTDSGAYYYPRLIQEMIDQGKLDRLEEAIDASPEDAGRKAGHASRAIQAFADQGMPKKVEAIAAKYQPNPSANQQRVLAKALVKAHTKAGDDSKAKAMIGEMFEAGLKSDANAPEYGNRNFIAQQAATEAFELGLFDYGLELYGKAERKNRVPLATALATDGFEEKNLPIVLMTAHDNLSSPDMAVIVNFAVSYLRKQG